MTASSICVCGAGTMGSGIAQLAAQSGFYTILYEVSPSVLQKAESSIKNNLRVLVEKGKITEEDKSGIFKRILFTDDIQNCIADVFIEAIIEKADQKIALFNQLAEINHSESIFCSNTSSLSLEETGSKIQVPERFIGMHFFNPPVVMKLIEVVSTSFTNKETVKKIQKLATQMNKISVLCKDSPGFIVNRVARPYYIESFRLVEDGIADFDALDSIMEASGFKMGPFKLMDLIGNDVNYAVSCSVYQQLNLPERLKPSYIQQQKVQLGELGRKSAKGYYTY